MRCFAMILSLRLAVADCLRLLFRLYRQRWLVPLCTLRAVLRTILGLGVSGGGLVLARAISPDLQADGVTGEGGERSGAAELRALHGQRQQRLQRRAVENLEHVEPPAPVGEVEVADDAGDLDAVIRFSHRALVELLEP